MSVCELVRYEPLDVLGRQLRQLDATDLRDNVQTNNLLVALMCSRALGGPYGISQPCIEIVSDGLPLRADGEPTFVIV